MSKNEIIIFDGAMGSVLNSIGLMCECNEMLNLTNPGIISEIHNSYALSGAEYVKTNTFGASPLKLRKSNNDDLAFELNTKAIELARLSGAKVAGDIGPSGELYYPYSDISTLDIYNSYLVQAMALKDADIILIETMSSIIEANLAYLAVRNFNTDIPVIISFTYDNGYTMMGCSPEQIAKAFNSYKLFAIGTNCSGGPSELVSVVKEYNKFSNHRICAMPNAGLPILQDDKTVYPFSPEKFSNEMLNIIRAGATVIGGCCGTTPEHIAKLSALMNYNSSESNRANSNDIYISTEREFCSVDNAVISSSDYDEILKVEDLGAVARIDVRNVSNLIEYFNELNLISSKPKCFIADKDQELMIRILYHGITDIIF